MNLAKYDNVEGQRDEDAHLDVITKDGKLHKKNLDARYRL